MFKVFNGCNTDTHLFSRNCQPGGSHPFYPLGKSQVPWLAEVPEPGKHMPARAIASPFPVHGGQQRWGCTERGWPLVLGQTHESTRQGCLEEELRWL